MKKLFFLLSIVSFNYLIFAQEAEIILPSVTTIVPASVEQKIVISEEDIEARHFETLSDVIEGSGIQLLNYGPYGMDSKASIRGFTDETVRVVIDGICVNNVRNGLFDYSALNLKQVEKIEIVRGGFTEGVEDEGAVAGAIYITMKKNELKKALQLDLSAKTFFNSDSPLDSVFQKVYFSRPLGENTFLTSSGSLNYAQNRYFYKAGKMGDLPEGAFGGLWYGLDYQTDGTFVNGISKPGYWKTCENAQVTDAHADAYITHYFNDGNYFSIGDSFYGGHKHASGRAFSDNPGLQRNYDNNLSFVLWNPAIGDGLFNLKNSLVWLCNNLFYKDKAGKENSSHYGNTIKYTGSADFTSLAGGRLRQLVGLSADYTKLDSTNDGQHFQFSGVLKETTKIALGGGWSVSLPLAAKFCVNDNKTNFAFVPKLGTAWQGERVQLFTDLYRMVQFPLMDDLYWQGVGYQGNPDLIPESGWGADLGINLGPFDVKSGKLHGGLTLFSDYYKDKIKWGSGTTENLSSAFYLGLDFDFGAELFDGFFTVDLNGEYLYNRLLDKSDKMTYGKQIMWTPDFVCSAAFGFNFELAKILLSASYTGRCYKQNSNIYYLKPYLLLNLSAEGAEIGGHFTPYLKAENLLNWQYQAVDRYPMPGISLTIGARYIF